MIDKPTDTPLARERGPIRHWLWAALVAGAGVLATVFLVTAKPDPQPAEVPFVAPPVVRFVPAAPSALSIPVITQGTVRPERELTLVSQVSGRVVEVSDEFVAGGFFDAGVTLIQIEPTDYELAITRAESQVASARRSLAEEEGRALQAEREWRELSSVKANDLFLRKPQIEAAGAALAAAKADLSMAHLNLERTSLSLPFDGRIIDRSADLGQYINAGSPIARVYGVDRVQVRLPITDRQLALLSLPLSGERSGFESLVVLRATVAGQPQEWSARIARTEATLDEESRSLYAVAVVECPFESPEPGRPPLIPGMFVEAEIQGKPLQNVTRLPRSALRVDGKVLLIDREDRISDREVRTVFSDAESVWLKGLAGGERVVLGEDLVLVRGMAVSPRPADQYAQEYNAP